MRRLTVFSVIMILSLFAATLSTARAQEEAHDSDRVVRVRVIHASPDAPPVKILINDRFAFGLLRYKGVARYLKIPAGNYNIKVISADRDQTVLIDTSLDLVGGMDYSIAAVGSLANIEPLLLVDNNDLPEFGKAKVRFVHLSPNAPVVNVAVRDGEVLFRDIPFKGVGDYATLDAGRYNLEVRGPDGAVALDIPGKGFPPGTVSTVFAVGLLNDRPPLQALSGIDRRPSNSSPGYRPCCPPPPSYRPPCCPRPQPYPRYHLPFFNHPLLPYQSHPPRYQPPYRNYW